MPDGGRRPQQRDAPRLPHPGVLRLRELRPGDLLRPRAGRAHHGLIFGGGGKDFIGAWGFTDWEITWLPPVVLAGMMILTLIIILITLKRRDSI